MTHFKYKFNITSFLVWETGDLLHLDASTNVISGLPNLTHVSPIVKRRMPQLSKYIYDLFNRDEEIERHVRVPMVFTSKNAELNRTFNIIRSYDSDVSPTQFSMSVHNAIAGLLSVICKNNNVYTVIDSLSGSLETAFIEANSLLADNKYVDIIYFDENLPSELLSLYPEYNKPIILKIRIEKGEDFHLQAQTKSLNCYENHVHLIDFFNNKKKSYINTTDRITWKWTNETFA